MSWPNTYNEAHEEEIRAVYAIAQKTIAIHKRGRELPRGLLSAVLHWQRMSRKKERLFQQYAQRSVAQGGHAAAREGRIS